MTLFDLDMDFKVTIFSTLNISETTRDRRARIVTVEHQWEVIGSLSNGDIFNDLHGPLTRFSLILTWHYCNVLFVALPNTFSYEDKRLA